MIFWATGRLEVVIQESPKPEDFELACDQWAGLINKTLATYELVAGGILLTTLGIGALIGLVY